jgi:hypothetical protein
MIGKEHRPVTPTCPSTRVLTLRKVTVQHQLVVRSSSNEDDLPLVKQNTRIDLNPGGARICYTQEPTLVLDSPPSSPSCYIVLGQHVGAGYGKVLIPNPDYNGKGRTESASSNLTPRLRCRPPPKICGPPEMMEFSDNEEEEEKEELSNELVTSLK